MYVISKESTRKQKIVKTITACTESTNLNIINSVPNPDPPDPHVFGPSGSISQRYGSGSGSFYQLAKIVRKTLIPTVFDFFWTFIFEK
jgi:hypothetical protein